MDVDSARLKLLDLIHRKKRAYQALFLVDGKPNPNAVIVLADLRRFSRFNRGGLVVSPVSRMTDPYATAYQAGLRDMYTRILMMLELDGADVKENSSGPE